MTLDEDAYAEHLRAAERKQARNVERKRSAEDALHRDVDLRAEGDALSMFETIGATVACAIIASSPVWIGLLVDALAPGNGVAACAAALLFVVALPAALRTPRTRHLNAWGRWGAHFGMALRLPIELARITQQRRSTRALSAKSTSTAVTALNDEASKSD